MQLRAALGLLCIVCFVGSAALLGHVRMIYILTNKIIGKYASSEVRQEHAKLISQIAFLEKQVQAYQANLSEIRNHEKGLRLKYGMTEIPDDVRLAGGGARSQEEHHVRPVACAGGHGALYAPRHGHAAGLAHPSRYIQREGSAAA